MNCTREWCPGRIGYRAHLVIRADGPATVGYSCDVCGKLHTVKKEPITDSNGFVHFKDGKHFSCQEISARQPCATA
jgi:hypothetical protein